MSSSPEDRRLVIITAVKAETRAVLAALTQPRRIVLPGIRAWDAHAGHRSVTLVQAGVGPIRAHAAMKAVTVPHDLVVSVGFAGALVTGASPGDVVLPHTIVWEDDIAQHRYVVPTEAWQIARASLPRDLGMQAIHGPILSSPIVVASTMAKHAAAVRVGAVAVEMEAAGLIMVARERGAAVLALRVILDTVDVSLERWPADLDSSWLARAQLVGRPVLWPGVLALARQIPHVAGVLTRLMVAVLPNL